MNPSAFKEGDKLIKSPNSPFSFKVNAAFPTILGVAAVIFGLDQLTKALIVQNIREGESWSLFPALAPLFKFTFVTNTGAAFGMFSQLGGVFIIIALVVIFGIILFYHHLPTGNLWVRLCLGLQLGGALGNLVDRITREYVVDFVDIGFWPIFNLADVSILLGVTTLAYFLWDEERLQDSPPPNTGQVSEGGNL